MATSARLPSRLLKAAKSEVCSTDRCVPQLAPIAKLLRVKKVESPVVMRRRVVKLEELSDLRQGVETNAAVLGCSRFALQNGIGSVTKRTSLE